MRRPRAPPRGAGRALVLAALTTGTCAVAAPALAAPGRTVGEAAVAVAAQQAGKPYVWGAQGPAGFDCSGLVRYAYGRVGVALPRTSQQQSDATTHVPLGDVRTGDVLFFATPQGRVHHDALYAGGGRMWAAPHTGDVVRLQKVYRTPSAVGRPGPRPRLVARSRGPAVSDLQRRLHLRADGAFGAGTRAAVAAFQARRHLTVDGVVGPRTWSALGR